MPKKSWKRFFLGKKKNTNKAAFITPFSNGATLPPTPPADTMDSNPKASRNHRPFTQCPLPEPGTNSGCNEEITSTIFYFPGIDRKKSERILLRTNIEDNTFLIRDGSKTGSYVLTVRKDSKVDHCMIYIQNGKYSLEGTNRFNTIEEMTNHYSTTIVKSKLLLSNCLSREDADELVMATRDDASKLAISFASSKQVILPARVEDELDLHFKISSSDIPASDIPASDIPANQPISMCLVVDVSSSMTDQMLVLKASLQSLLSVFRDTDKLSIVTFSNSSEVKLGLTTMNEDGKKQAKKVISSLFAYGSTNIEAGLFSGIDIYSVLDPQEATAIEYIMLFTDGGVNEGCQSYPEMKTAAEVAISRIQVNSAKYSVNRHIVISVVAFGSEPHEELMYLSDAGNGLYYLMNVFDDPDCAGKLQNTFALVLSSTRKAAKDIVLKIQPNPQIQLCPLQYLGDNYRLISSGSAYTIKIPDLVSGTSKDIIFPIKFTKNCETCIHCEVLATVTMTAQSFITDTQVNLVSECGVIMDSTYNEYSDISRDCKIQLLRNRLLQTLEDLQKAGSDGRLGEVHSLIKPMLEKLVDASMSDEELIRCFIETLLVVANQMNSSESFERSGNRLLQQLRQAHACQSNTVTTGDLRIPVDAQILTGLNLDFELGDFLNLSVYDGEVQMDIQNRMSHYFESIYADPRELRM